MDRWGFEPQASRLPAERYARFNYRPFKYINNNMFKNLVKQQNKIISCKRFHVKKEKKGL